MFDHWIWEPLRAYWARKRLERQQRETAARLLAEAAAPQRVADDPDADDWRPLTLAGKDADDLERQTLRDRSRYLADHNPYARNVLALHRNYTVGTGMQHEIIERPRSAIRAGTRPADAMGPEMLAGVRALWDEFLAANDWATGNRKDWEFCMRTWRDGECFLRLFRQPTWPPRLHFVDPEHVAPDPRTGEPGAGIATLPGNVEVPLAYCVHSMTSPVRGLAPRIRGDASHGSAPADDAWGRCEQVDASLMLHTKIGVDANVKRGVPLLLPVLDALQRFQGWLDVELIQRKVASSIVLVRKHAQGHPAGLGAFADAAATSLGSGSSSARRLKLQPGTIIDVQGYDLQFLSPDTHFDDASLLGRMILLSIAAGTGLPEFMLTADAANGNYASTLVAEGPAVRQFASWQAFFIGQWQKLFGMAMAEAVRLGLLDAAVRRRVALHITPPPLAARNRLQEAQADALYFDRGALSARELARRDHADPEQMQRERRDEGRT